jgi:hypothetical protein
MAAGTALSILAMSSSFRSRFRSEPCSVLIPVGGSGRFGGAGVTSGYVHSLPFRMQVSQGASPPVLLHLILDLRHLWQAMLDRRGWRFAPFLFSAPGLPGLPPIMVAVDGGLLSSSAGRPCPRYPALATRRGGLLGSGWRPLGTRSDSWCGGGAAEGSGGSVGGSVARRTANASWYLRFGVDWAVVADAVEASSASDGSGGERIDWMRNWEAILTAAGVPRGDPQIRSRKTSAPRCAGAGQDEAGPSRDGLHVGGGGWRIPQELRATRATGKRRPLRLCLCVDFRAWRAKY